MGALERIFESFLWESRLVVLLAVVASLAAAFAMFFMASVDAVYMIGRLLQFAAGIALLGLALYLSHLGDKSHPD